MGHRRLREVHPRGRTLRRGAGAREPLGPGADPQGILRIVDAVDSPWLQITTDTGRGAQFEEPYERPRQARAAEVLVQAKTYYGGGQWYTLDLDYAHIGAILNEHGYRGWISLEFEGMESYRTAIPQSLELLRASFPRR